jgi:hypothetical protein
MTDRLIQAASETGRVGIIALSRWCESVWLAKTVNIAGRVYITEAAILEFMRRAQAGEFAGVHKVPPPTGH